MGSTDGINGKGTKIIPFKKTKNKKQKQEQSIFGFLVFRKRWEKK